MIVITRGSAKATRLRGRFASTTSKAPRKAHANRPPHSPLVSKQYKPSARKPQPQPPSSPPRSSDTLQSLWRRSWLPLSGAALLAGFLGFYIIGTATASLKSCPCRIPREHATPTGRPPALTGDNAEQFDKELDFSEWWMGIAKLRKKLAHHAKGDVLELAMGTGRNLQYYTWEALGEAKPAAGRKASRGITSFTGLDISADMLDVARRRLVAAVPPMAGSEFTMERATLAGQTGGHLSFLNDRLRLVCSDAHQPLPRPDNATRLSSTETSATYDTIIQTFGLCSVSDPVAVLCNLASAVKPDSGRIFLLEHGKGWYGLVNGLLDKNADKHFEKYGCWWNRDIESLVDQALQKTPGLEIVKLHRPNPMQMGTLVWVELRMRGKK
ncbi:hypothetical protein ED733_006596 [Metarhizium rileyi]|uniref:Ubiquinone/menaquinone biosynthesis-related protein n=1 Tax=Metarhizium rileyi (strain RCEF 4871) TaxID=1649241 RepID=A0A5C6GER0_METRR|nr:hypothetical protein ED733_006596 [Metarhizium rileyi]